MAYYFQAKQLCVGYQNQPLIQNIEIELKKGEILTLIGPNGAGKSTILKALRVSWSFWEAVSFWRIKICRAFRDVSWQKRWRLSLQNGRIQS